MVNVSTVTEMKLGVDILHKGKRMADRIYFFRHKINIEVFYIESLHTYTDSPNFSRHRHSEGCSFEDLKVITEYSGIAYIEMLIGFDHSCWIIKDTRSIIR